MRLATWDGLTWSRQRSKPCRMGRQSKIKQSCVECRVSQRNVYDVPGINMEAPRLG